MKPGVLGWNWAMFAYRGWLTLSALDEQILDKVVPRVCSQRVHHRNQALAAAIDHGTAT